MEDFQHLLGTAVAHDAQQLHALTPTSEFYAAALVTDENLDTVRLSLATKESLHAKAQDYGATSLIDIAAIAWNPDEWDLNDYDLTLHHGAVSKVNELSKTFSHQWPVIREKEYQNDLVLFRDAYIESACAGFKAARLPEIFGHPLYLFIEDFDGETTVADCSGDLLNSGKMLENFKRRYDISFPFYPRMS